MAEVQRTHTPFTLAQGADALLKALHAAGILPHRQEGLLMLAQLNVETANGEACNNDNPGNLTADENGTHDFFRPIWYLEEDATTPRLKQLHDLMLDGKAPKAFRAYSSLEQGVTDYVAELKKRFPSLLRAAESGDPVAFAAAIKTSGYAPDAPAGTDNTMKQMLQSYLKAGVYSGLPLVGTGGPSQPSQPPGSDSPSPFTPLGGRADLPLLMVGSHGTAVELWQRLLGAQATGFFTSATDAATREYQARHGLKIDGKVGPNTWGSVTQAK